MATAVAGRDLEKPRRTGDPVPVTVYCWATTVCYFALLGPSLAPNWRLDESSALTLITWTGVALVADMLRVRLWDEFSFAMSLPVTLAAAMVLEPWQASVVAFLGSLELRELKGEVPIARNLFNRAQVGVSIFFASVVFNELGGNPSIWPAVLLPACAAFLVDTLFNVALVLLPVSLLHGSRPTEVLRRVFGPQPMRAIVVYTCLAVLAPAMALAYQTAGLTALLALAAPLALAWTTYRQAQRLQEAAIEIQEKNRAIIEASEQTARERREERLSLAGELHDEVLPALFQVHLMGQVVRQDLEQGRLLELDLDVPQLLEATTVAQSSIRGVLGNLRRSPLGRGGLLGTVRMLAKQLAETSDVRFNLELAEVDASPVSQLLSFQVAREAMTNAARYSRASKVEVKLNQSERRIRLVITDDGVGFDRSLVDAASHFGLQLMSERVVAANGDLVIDSRLGAGTTVAAAIPTDL